MAGVPPLDDALAFVRAQHRAVLATTRADGRPQLSPVVAGVDDQGHVVISTRAGTAKVANLRRRPAASVLVLSDTFFGPWVQLDGPVEIVELPDAMPGLEAYYRQVAGEHPDWDEYRRAMAAEHRVLLRLRPERAGPAHSR